jgi:hypothetical protein
MRKFSSSATRMGTFQMWRICEALVLRYIDAVSIDGQTADPKLFALLQAQGTW